MTQGTSETPQGGERKAGHAVLHAGHGHDQEHGHDHLHDQHPFLQHHFDTPQQQFDAGKLGIWLFLVQEVLFFAGLFCAYTIYRSQNPEIFAYSHYFLDTKLGALNTIVLIFSSVTAAWAVRCAQLEQQRLLVINILATIGCALIFLCVKYVEYSHKVHDGLLWGKHFNPTHEVWETEAFKSAHPEAAKLAAEIKAAAKAGGTPAGEVTQPAAGNVTAPTAAPGSATPPAAGAQAAASGTANPSAPGAAVPEETKAEQGSANTPNPSGAAAGPSDAEEKQKAAADKSPGQPIASAAPNSAASAVAPAPEVKNPDPKAQQAQTGVERTAPGDVSTPGMETAGDDRRKAEGKRSAIAGPGVGAKKDKAGGANKDQAEAGKDPSYAAREAQPTDPAAGAAGAGNAAAAGGAAAPAGSDPAAATAAAPATGAVAAAVSDAMQADQIKGVSLQGRDIKKEIEPLVEAGLIGEKSSVVTSIAPPKKAHVFFGIYFFMTGLHGIHVLAGIIVWVWLLFRALKGQFGKSYFGPIDFAALYWHLVDLIWIYLFPLLYLID